MHPQTLNGQPQRRGRRIPLKRISTNSHAPRSSDDGETQPPPLPLNEGNDDPPNHNYTFQNLSPSSPTSSTSSPSANWVSSISAAAGLYAFGASNFPPPPAATSNLGQMQAIPSVDASSVPTPSNTPVALIASICGVAAILIAIVTIFVFLPRLRRRHETTAITREGGAAWNLTPWRMTMQPVQLREPRGNAGSSAMQRLKSSVAVVGAIGGCAPARKARTSEENFPATAQEPASPPTITHRNRPSDLHLSDPGNMVFRNPFEENAYVVSPKWVETLADVPLRQGGMGVSTAVRQSLGGSPEILANGAPRENSMATTPPALYESNGSQNSPSSSYFDSSATLAVPVAPSASQGSADRRASDWRESMLGRGESYYWKRPPSPLPPNI